MSFQDFQKSPNRLSFRDVGFLIIATIVVILVISALGMANYYLAGILPEGGEFSLLRIGGRSFLYDRIEPYTNNIPVSVQLQVYGRTVLPGEDHYIFDIPFHLALVFFPLALIPDALTAWAFFMTLIEIGLVGLLIISFRLIGRKISRLLMISIFVACSSSLYAYLSFLEGSPVILLGLAYVGILLALRSGIDELAGALILLSGFQWEVGGLFLFFIILWVYREKRWRVLSGAAMLGFLLFTISFFLYPGWVLPFLSAAWNSLRTGYGFSSHAILASLWPEHGATLGWVVTTVLISALGFEWQKVNDANSYRFVWAAFLALAITPLLGQHVQMDQLVLLSMPLMIIMIVSRERWRKLGVVITILLFLFFFGAPWLLYKQGLPQGIDLVLTKEEILFLFWPVSTIIGLYWMRWWILHPPRTWMDTQGER